jgi:hypothetical protein
MKTNAITNKKSKRRIKKKSKFSKNSTSKTDSFFKEKESLSERSRDIISIFQVEQHCLKTLSVRGIIATTSKLSRASA